MRSPVLCLSEKSYFYYDMTFRRLGLAFLLTLPFLWAQSLQELADRKMRITDSLNRLAAIGIPIGPPPGVPMPLTLSESDCQNAIQVCQQTYTYTSSPPNFGTVQELGGNTCLLNREQKTAWFIFTVQSSGTFGFTINTTYDYDFALFDYGAIGGCGGTSTATPIRCNYSAQYGNTGLDANNPVGGSLQWNASQPPIMPGINVTAGQTFVLVVDNWTGDATGFTITFTGTAQIFDNTPPAIQSVSCTSNPNQLLVTFNELIRCSSIHPSDFNLGGSVTVTAATGVGCGTYTTQVLLTFTGTLNSGTRTLTIQTGTDGNTIGDKCMNQIPTGTNFNFPYLGPLTVTASPATICTGSSSTLTVSAPGGIPGGATIAWSTGGTTASINVSPTSTTTYSVSVTFGGCSRSANGTVTVNPNPVISATPTTAVICSGTALITGTANIPGGQWQYNGGSGWTNTANPMNLPPGTHQIRYQSPDGCWSNIVSVTVSTAPPPSTTTCNVIYVTPSGSSAAAGTKADPTNLPEALNRAACSNTIIKMAVGDYIISAPITTITSNITLEGGFDPANSWRKTSQAGVTRILRNTSNVDGCGDNAPRLVALQISNASNFRLQDLTVEVQNAPAANSGCASGRGVSTYALYLSNCSGYTIVRCRFIAGNGSNGLPGANGSGFRADGSPGSGGAGGTGSTTRCGGCGGNGGAGTAASTGAAGGAGGSGCCGSGCNFLGCNASGCTGCTGANGQNGANGANGSTAPTPTPGVWFSPVQSPAGQPGGHGGGGGGGGGGDIGTCCVSTCHSGGTCGAPGGNGGRGGNPGQGGWGGGGAFCIYLYQNGGGSFVDIELNTPTAGSGGAGGLGAPGQAGGAPGSRCVHGCAGTPCNQGCCGGDCGAGGLGGSGGSGGNGGNGGTGHNGIAARIYLQSGSAPSLIQGGTNITLSTGSNNPTSFALSSQPIITVADIACTNTDISFSTGDPAPHSWNFGAGSTPSTSTSSPQNVQYSSTGRKTITYDGQTYTDFWNILIPNQVPTATASATSICPGTQVTFTADLIGINYQWQLATDAAFTNIIATGSTQNWNYTFTSAGTYYVRHRRYTDCCEWSPWTTTITITVHPLPAAPTASGTTPVCRGASLVYTATAPAGVTYEWYTAATGGTLAGTGSTITIPYTSGVPTWPTNYNAAGSYTLYVEAVSAQGCRSSTRTPVTIVVNQIPAPTASNVSRCGSGQVALTATYAGPGTPTYNWWDAPTGGTLLQSGGSNVYLANVTATTTFYVSVSVPGCVESNRTPVTVTVTAAPATDTWTGAVSTDWFTGGNWQSGCVPNCGTSVTIPAAPANQPVIGFNLTPAACNDITIQSGASLTFNNPVAELQVCGHFNHNGALNTTAGGRVRFIGTGVQNYARSNTATGDFYQVIIDKGGALLANRRVEVTNLPMVITNQLHFVSGRIGTTATNHVEITNNDPVSVTGYGVDNYVMGRLIRAIRPAGGLYAFPVGDRHESEATGNKGYQLAEVNLTATASVTSLRAFFTPTPQTVPTLSEPPCGTNYICALDNGFWTIEEAAGTGAPTYDLTLYSRNYTTCTGHPYYSIYKRDGGPWYLQGTCASPSTITQTRRNSFSDFSQFVVVGSSTPLPIASLSLSAQAGASAIRLEWQPDREDNVNRYTLLRSLDLQRFEPITETVADGGPYQYLDTQVQPGQIYYYVAIAQDAEGRELRRSNLAQASLSAEAFSFAAALQPNPTRNGTALLLFLPESDSLEIRAYNTLGQLVWMHKGYYEAGPYRQSLPSGDWARGVYAIELRGQRYTWSGKLIRE